MLLREALLLGRVHRGDPLSVDHGPTLREPQIAERRNLSSSRERPLTHENRG
jgi:hypothetical protein